MRLLVIEDEPDLLETLAEYLRGFKYAVDEASDGKTGLFKASGVDYDAIVLDLMLPELSGWEVLSELRKQKKTPVLILTARDGLPDRLRGLNSGADDYLSKPFELSELEARIRSLIRRSAGQLDTVIRVRGAEVNTADRTVRRNGVVVPLTASEYALVELLALHQGKLVTRTMVYDHLFDENHDSLSNTVNVHVANIRKKLGKDFITTRRGEGYQIDV